MQGIMLNELMGMLKKHALSFIFSLLFLFPSYSHAQLSDNGPCEKLAQTINTAKLTKRPKNFYDVMDWLSWSQSRNQSVYPGKEHPLDKPEDLIEKMTKTGVVSDDLKNKIQSFFEEDSSCYKSEIDIETNSDVIGVSCVTGSWYCQILEIFQRDKNNEWKSLPQLSAPKMEGKYCLESRASLARIGDQSFAVYGEDESAEITKFIAFHLKSDAQTDDTDIEPTIEPTCTFSVLFTKSYDISVFDTSIKNNETTLSRDCSSPLCQFVQKNGMELANLYQTGKSEVFHFEELPDTEAKTLIQKIIHSRGGPILKPEEQLKLWPMNAWVPGLEIFAANQEYGHIGLIDIRKDIPDDNFITYIPVEGHKSNTSYDLQEHWCQCKVTPFVYDNKMYFLRVGLGIFRSLYYPGLLFDVSIFDGKKMTQVLGGNLTETSLGLPTISYSNN